MIDIEYPREKSTLFMNNFSLNRELEHYPTRKAALSAVNREPLILEFLEVVVEFQKRLQIAHEIFSLKLILLY